MSTVEGVLISCFDVTSGTSEMGVMEEHAIYWNGARYPCSEYLSALWMSGQHEPDAVHDPSVHVEVDRANPLDVQVVICGHKEVCRIAVDPRTLLPAMLPAPRRASRASGARPKGEISYPRTLSTVLRLQTVQQRARERRTKSKRSWHRGRVNWALRAVQDAS